MAIDSRLTEPRRTHGLSFLKPVFDDSKRYPGVSISFGHTRQGELAGWIKKSRPGQPDFFHEVSLDQQTRGLKLRSAEAGVEPTGDSKPFVTRSALLKHLTANI